MANEMILTKKGFAELEARLEFLKTDRRAEIAEQIKIARSFGDLSENAEYDEARNEQSRIEGEILMIEKNLKLATVVDDEDIDDRKVGIATRVKLLDLGDKSEATYQIFGSVEADIKKGNISNESPVGSALIGHSVGETVEVHAPGGLMKFKILEISRADRKG